MTDIEQRYRHAYRIPVDDAPPRPGWLVLLMWGAACAVVGLVVGRWW